MEGSDLSFQDLSQIIDEGSSTLTRCRQAPQKLSESIDNKFNPETALQEQKRG